MPPPDTETGTNPGADLGADERLAEQFRQEFLDAMASRRQAAKPAKLKPGQKEEEKLKGPKLGGSRSQRAVMRERELEAQREREKKGRR